VRRTICTSPRHFLVFLILRKIADVSMGKVICIQYGFMDGHKIMNVDVFKPRFHEDGVTPDGYRSPSSWVSNVTGVDIW